jgi:predicted phosphodiesterase
MARFGVISDVHGNRDALGAVLARLHGIGVRDILCLGDLVGYCAEPNACVAIAKRQDFRAVSGNHELIATGKLDTSRCSKIAAHALLRTRAALSEAAHDYLTQLPFAAELPGGILLFHGTLGNVSEYMTTEARVRSCSERVLAAHPKAHLCLFGHTHEPKVYDIYDVNRKEVVERSAVGEIAFGAARHTFVNPGSVDASRSKDGKLARFAVLDTDAHTVRFEATAYDHERTERIAREQGYRMGASRLALVRSQELFVEARTRAIRAARRIYGRPGVSGVSPDKKEAQC